MKFYICLLAMMLSLSLVAQEGEDSRLIKTKGGAASGSAQVPPVNISETNLTTTNVSDAVRQLALFEVGSYTEILGRNYPLGSVIRVRENGAEYTVEATALNGYPTDSIGVVPVQNGFARIRPRDGVLNPTWFGPPIQPLQSTTAMEQRCMNYASADSRVGMVRYQPVSYRRGENEKVVIPYTIGTNTRKTFYVEGAGANIGILPGATGLAYYSADPNGEPKTKDLKVQIRGFTLKGNGAKGSGTKGMHLVGMSRGKVSEIYYETLDTAALVTFSLNSTYEDLWVSQSRTVGLLFAADGAPGIPKYWPGSTVTNSAFNVNSVRQIRVVGIAGGKSGIELKVGSSNRLQDITIEGAETDYGIYLNDYEVPVASGNIIENVHFEDQSADDGSICIYVGSIGGSAENNVFTHIKKQTGSGPNDTLVYMANRARGVFDRVSGPIIRETSNSYVYIEGYAANEPTTPEETVFPYDYGRVFERQINPIRNLYNLGGQNHTDPSFNGRMLVQATMTPGATINNRLWRFGWIRGPQNQRPWGGIFSGREGFVSTRMLDDTWTKDGGFGFQQEGEQVVDVLFKDTPKRRWFYDYTKRRFIWEHRINGGVGNLMELDSLGRLYFPRYGSQDFSAAALGKAAPITVLGPSPTDGTLTEIPISSLGGGGGAPDFQSGVGFPDGVSPRYVGDLYLSTGNNHWYRATGTTAGDWSKLSKEPHFTVTLAEGQSTYSASLPTTLPSTNYYPQVTYRDWNSGQEWVIKGSRTTTGFTFGFPVAAPAGGGEFRWTFEFDE